MMTLFVRLEFCRLASWALAAGVGYAWYMYDSKSSVNPPRSAGKGEAGFTAAEAKEWNAAVLAKQKAAGGSAGAPNNSKQ